MVAGERKGGDGYDRIALIIKRVGAVKDASLAANADLLVGGIH